jgi:hypothetical protein
VAISRGNQQPNSQLIHTSSSLTLRARSRKQTVVVVAVIRTQVKLDRIVIEKRIKERTSDDLIRKVIISES